MSESLIRPSTLPKLAQCRCFENKPYAGEAASRGTLLDAVIRKALAYGGDITRAAGELKATLSYEDMESIKWGIAQVYDLAKGSTEIITNELYLSSNPQVEGVKRGTMDTLLPDVQILVDYKTGQVRDYEAQMAAYALGCMNAYFTDTWMTVLLFIDQKIATYQRFTETQAREIVERIAKAPVEPTACEYCTWCNKFGTCELRKTMAEKAMQETEGLTKLTDSQIKAAAENPDTNDIVAKIVNDPDLAAEWCERADVVASIATAVKEAMRVKVDATENKRIGRWKIGKSSTSRVVPSNVIGHYIGELGNGVVLAAYGSMSVKKFEEIWTQRFPSKEPPRDQYIDGTTRKGTLSIEKIKANKPKNLEN